MISSADFHGTTKVVDLIVEGSWIWPIEWNDKFPNLCVPIIEAHRDDDLIWRDSKGVLTDISVQNIWDDIRNKATKVPWYRLVRFNQCIPKHAFLLWPIMLRKLKTQDVLQAWDVQGGATLNLSCFLCGSQPDSHSHLFYECRFASDIWNDVKIKVVLQNSSNIWNGIIMGLIPIAHKR
uniref:uncharacterized protein LOC122583310 n=1 Tax=Erigeron canadensis TaxID=72917 RepID=UPI001CB9252C|nr:uncharacterized protein LOC122583310 [Erigeron canadensis]